MSSTHSQAEAQTVAKRLSAMVSQPVAIVLIGSVARNCATARSDLDLLVVGEERPNFKLRWRNVEFHTFDQTKFLFELKSGSDFPSWCTRFGVPLVGKQYWESILHKSEHSHWPDWKRKITVAARRLLATQLSIGTNDKEAAAECALFAYDHLIRGLLLRNSIFPLSRPELVEQIRPLAPELGDSLFGLLRDPVHAIDFRHILQPLMGTLKEIDHELYAECSESMRRILLQSRANPQAAKISKRVSIAK